MEPLRGNLDALRVVAVIAVSVLVLWQAVAATWRITRWIAHVNDSIDKIDRRLWDLEHKP